LEPPPDLVVINNHIQRKRFQPFYSAYQSQDDIYVTELIGWCT
jgi:hypothetical protein